MLWIVYSFLSILFYSILNVFDKFFLSKKFKNIYTFAVILNVFSFLFFAVIAYFIQDSFVLNQGLLWTTIASILLYLMWIFWWKALSTGEVSRVIAIFYTNPIFNAILAAIFLKESITTVKWLAIILIVAGAILSSWDGKKIRNGLNKTYLYALLAALFGSVGNIFAKTAMVYWPALTVQTAGFLIAFPLYLSLLFNKKVLFEVKNYFVQKKSYGQMFLRSLLGFLAACSFMLAIGAGPVSLVVALNGAQPMLILIFSTLLSIFYPKIIKEVITRQAMTTKVTAIILIVIGIVLISLF